MTQRSVDVLGNASCKGFLKVTRITQVALREQIASDPWRIWKLVPIREGNPLAVSDDGKHNAPTVH